VQFDPIKPTVKAPGTKRLKLRYDEPPLKFAFKLNLRRYIEGTFPPFSALLVSADGRYVIVGTRAPDVPGPGSGGGGLGGGGPGGGCMAAGVVGLGRNRSKCPSTENLPLVH